MIKFQFGSFESIVPGWFDWFSLVITVFVSIISIYGGYKIATVIYNREKKDRKKEDEKLDLAEFNLFKNSLIQLKEAIDNQNKDILDYIQKKDFLLIFHQNVNVDFLQFVNAKKIYLILGVENKDAIEQINDLLKRLYLLYDFRTSLRDEVRTYIKRYNELEKEFYLYRDLLYFEYYGLSNNRAISIKIENERKMWNFKPDDKFMQDYTELIMQTLNNKSIIENNELISRENLNSKFVIEISKISSKYIPEDVDAIHINNLSNKVNAAFINLQKITSSHFKAMESYSKNLKITAEKIETFIK